MNPKKSTHIKLKKKKKKRLPLGERLNQALQTPCSSFEPGDFIRFNRIKWSKGRKKAKPSFIYPVCAKVLRVYLDTLYIEPIPPIPLWISKEPFAIKPGTVTNGGIRRIHIPQVLMWTSTPINPGFHHPR